MLDLLILFVILSIASVAPIYALVEPMVSSHSSQDAYAPMMMLLAFVLGGLWFMLNIPMVGFVLMAVGAMLLYRLISDY